MGPEERDILLKAIKIFKKDRLKFQNMWLNLALGEGVQLHEFMNLQAFLKSYFGCLNKDAKKLIEIIEREFKLMIKQN